MKHFKRLGIFKNSTGTLQYNPLTKAGYSYAAQISMRVGKTVFVTASHYSQTTSSHESCILSHLEETLTHYDRVPFPGFFNRERAIEYVTELEQYLTRPRARKQSLKYASAAEDYKKALDVIDIFDANNVWK